MKNMSSLSKPSLLSTALLAAAFMAGPTSYAGDDASSFADAISEGDASVVLRYRYEFVEQDNMLKDANASTLKTRLNFKTKSWKDLTFKVEVDNVTDIFSDNFNSTANGNADYSVVADPNGTDLNQAWAQYSGIEGTILRYGRQRIVLDNQRFVGGVAWRQNEQTYDSFLIENNSIKDTKISYSYLWNVNRIFGPEGAKSDIESDTHLFNLSYTGLSFGKLSAYGYFLDAQDGLATNAAFNTATVGVRLAGSKLGDNKNWSYEFEYADQSDYDDNPVSFSADYLHLKGGYTTDGMTFGLGFEVLSSDANAGIAFSTPLATLHKFNGWADQFLGTPADGLEDLYASFATKLSDYKLLVVFHDFAAENSSNDYGSELDLVVSRKFSKNYSVAVKYAAYSAGVGKVDADKLWVMFTASY